VRAFRAFDTFAGAGERAWLLAIVRNVAYTALNACKRSCSGRLNFTRGLFSCGQNLSSDEASVSSNAPTRRSGSRDRPLMNITHFHGHDSGNE